ncbi:MAG: carboxypeptidase regulatory-like domain-containing protein [Terracidiphilus sp.]|jgi:hypothetical protein
MCIRLIAGVCFSLLFSGASLLAAQEQSLPAQQADQSTPVHAVTRVTVQGVVRNAVSGEPLPRALVQIEGDADTGTLTDGEGHFEIPNVPAGPQTIRIVKPGYRDRPYATEETGLQAEGPAHSVLLAAQMPDLIFSLSPNCAIHGHIELSTGDPADGINLVLVKQVVRSGRAIWAQEAFTRTNGDGTYRFGGLPDGIYAVYTQPALESEPAVSLVAAASAAKVARSGYASVFYPDARELSGASRIRLSGGSQAEANFLLPLEPFYPVTAVATTQSDPTGAGKASQQGGYTAVVMDASGHLLPYFAQYDQTTHTLQANLPDGTYSLVVRGFVRPQSEGDFIVDRISFPLGQSRSNALAGSTEFTVAGHAVTGLRVPLGPPQTASVRLRLVHTGEGPPNAVLSGNNATEFVNLGLDAADGIPLNGGDSVWSMDNAPDTISFTAQPGLYWLNVFLPRKGVCAGSFNAGSFNLAHEPLPMSLAASPPPMEFTLSDDCGTMALTLPPTLAGFLPGEEPFYTVYVVPDFDTVQTLPPMTMHPSSGATLSLDGLAPGSYHVYMFDSPVHLEYRNPAALSALPVAGQPVTVSAGATSNLVLEAPEH